MALGNPGLVVTLARGGLGAREVGIGVGNNLALAGLLGNLSAGRALGVLGEQGFDPGLVYEVESAAEGTGEDEVEEDAAAQVSTRVQIFLRHKNNVATT